MRHGDTLRSLTLALAVGFAAAVAPAAPLAAAPAAQPERLSASPFDVSVAGGVVTVSFTLALSDVSTYPVTITAISGSVEEVIYEGTLGEGVYRLSAPLQKIKGSGELRVILKTRLTNRSEKGSDSYNVYLRWQGRL